MRSRAGSAPIRDSLDALVDRSAERICTLTWWKTSVRLVALENCSMKGLKLRRAFSISFRSPSGTKSNAFRPIRGRSPL